MLRGVQSAVDKAWNSPKVQEARSRAHATLDKVATLSPEEQEAYWRGVSERLKAKTEELRQQREAAEQGKR